MASLVRFANLPPPKSKKIKENVTTQFGQGILAPFVSPSFLFKLFIPQTHVSKFE